MATKKKEEELAAPEAQSGYDTSGFIIPACSYL